MGYLTICIFQNSFSILISLLYSNSPTHPPHFIFISSHYYSPFVMLYITSFTQFPSTNSQSHPLSSSRLQLISSSSFSSFLNLTIPSVLLIFFASFSDLLHHFLFLLFFFSLQIHARISDRKANFFRNTVEPAYDLNGFSGQTSIQAVLSYCLHVRFLYIKNRFHERFTVNLVRPYSPVWV